MVPMGDNLNHSWLDCTNDMINIKKHLDYDSDSNYMKPQKIIKNHSKLFNSKGIDEPHQLVHGCFDRDVY